jgi:hypothetical protein
MIMTDIVNLRQARKAKARAVRETEAERNRIRYGEPAALRRARKDGERRTEHQHEGHRLVATRVGSADGDPPS